MARAAVSPLLAVVAAALVLAVIVLAAGRPQVEAPTATITTTVTRTVTVTSTVTSTAAAPGCGGCCELVLDRGYPRVAAQLIENARSCVCIAMFAMKYDPGDPDDPVNDLLRMLAAKAREGVRVAVVVDDVTAREYPETIDFLKSAGILVKLDESKRRTLHAKMVIVDNETLLLGSHNWSESAMKYNHEASLVCRDPATVAEAVRYFQRLLEYGRPA